MVTFVIVYNIKPNCKIFFLCICLGLELLVVAVVVVEFLYWQKQRHNEMEIYPCCSNV
jgi:hypothetical protein